MNQGNFEKIVCRCDVIKRCWVWKSAIGAPPRYFECPRVHCNAHRSHCCCCWWWRPLAPNFTKFLINFSSQWSHHPTLRHLHMSTSTHASTIWPWTQIRWRSFDMSVKYLWIYWKWNIILEKYCCPARVCVFVHNKWWCLLWWILSPVIRDPNEAGWDRSHTSFGRGESYEAGHWDKVEHRAL